MDRKLIWKNCIQMKRKQLHIEMKKLYLILYDLHYRYKIKYMLHKVVIIPIWTPTVGMCQEK